MIVNSARGELERCLLRSSLEKATFGSWFEPFSGPMVEEPGGGTTACAEAEGGALQKKKRIHKSWKERGRKEKRRDRSKLNEKRRADRAAKRAEKLQVHAAIPLMKSPQAP